MDRSVGCCKKKLTCRGRGPLTSQTSGPAGSGGCRRCTRSSPAAASDPERRLRLPVRTGEKLAVFSNMICTGLITRYCRNDRTKRKMSLKGNGPVLSLVRLIWSISIEFHSNCSLPKAKLFENGTVFPRSIHGVDFDPARSKSQLLAA
jgi:hypothetical protein